MSNSGPPEQSVADAVLASMPSADDAVLPAHAGVRAKYEAMRSIVDRWPIGVVVVGSGCLVHETNDRSRQILALDDGIRIDGGVLKASSDSDTERLGEAVEVALNGRRGFDNRDEDIVVLPRPSGQRGFNALVAPLAVGPGVPCEPLAVIFLSDLSQPLEIDPSRLKILYDFTAAEARVAALLVRGLKLKDIALYLGVSPNTVKVQMKNIFAKTDCDRQAELVRTVLSGVSVVRKP